MTNPAAAHTINAALVRPKMVSRNARLCNLKALPKQIEQRRFARGASREDIGQAIPYVADLYAAALGLVLWRPISYPGTIAMG